MHMRELMADPIYRAYMKKTPPRDDAFNQADQWRIWVNVDGTNKWMTAQYATYRDAWPTFVARHKAGNYDATISSRRTFYAPPGEWYRVKIRRTPSASNPAPFKIETRWRQTFTWVSPPHIRLDWCARCRRPVHFQPLFETHHALSRFPVVSDEDNIRCPVCGIRRSALPDSYDQMVRM